MFPKLVWMAAQAILKLGKILEKIMEGKNRETYQSTKPRSEGVIETE
jgi:hypothetical protein